MSEARVFLGGREGGGEGGWRHRREVNDTYNFFAFLNIFVFLSLLTLYTFFFFF